MPEEKGYKLRCVVCGDSTGCDDAAKAMRTFSFGPGPDDVEIYIIVGVCPNHHEINMADLRRHFYDKVFQLREWETANGLEIVPHEEETPA